uniref:Rad51-like C-terminal domain-containing protein n=1 Tax=Ditylum brightwellii TaxID=49249 RepID=A0A6S9BBP6_9STRA|mmetsp:Transcript_27805/g.36947  ORF Transcript_27805/g.36947 Transcript_27805/m.36947 type:complete len:105 (-) Transcript_27805:120-434(-)
MTTKVGSGSSADVVSTSGGDLNDTTKLVPALGESWAHATTTRLLLDFMPSGVRCCRLVKSPHKAAGTALYDVTENGIRDVPPSSLPRQRNDLTLDASKRPRTNY